MKFIFLFVLLLNNNLFAASITKTNGTVDELKIITIKGEIISGDKARGLVCFEVSCQEEAKWRLRK